MRATAIHAAEGHSQVTAENQGVASSPADYERSPRANFNQTWNHSDSTHSRFSSLRREVSVDGCVCCCSSSSTSATCSINLLEPNIPVLALATSRAHPPMGRRGGQKLRSRERLQFQIFRSISTFRPCLGIGKPTV